MYITIVELPEYIKRVERLLDEEERSDLIYFLSTHPKAGVVLQGTGGIRKLRRACKGKGKSGGIRVIYFFYDEDMPLFMLTIFGKGEKENLSKSERNELAKLVKLLMATYKRKKQ